MHLRRVLLAGAAALPLAWTAIAVAQGTTDTDPNRQVVVEPRTPDSGPPPADAGPPETGPDQQGIAGPADAGPPPADAAAAPPVEGPPPGADPNTQKELARTPEEEPPPVASPFAPPGAVGQVAVEQADKLPAGLQRPNDPLEAAAFQVLQKHCARCHQDGMLSARQKPAKNFGNVLNLNEIADQVSLVQAGNAEGSRILQMILKQEMPYDVFVEFDTKHPEPTEEEVTVLRKWIDGLGNNIARICAQRKFVTNDEMVQTIANDLQALPDHRVKRTRYITLSNLLNGCTKKEAMDVYRRGVVKLLNSLSRASDVIGIEAIDPQGTILRFNLDDLGWEEAEWDAILKNYPYGMELDDRMFGFLGTLTSTKLPYVRGDWFAFTASRPAEDVHKGLYERLLGLPNTFQDLQVALGVDVDANIKKLLVKRAGFQKSGVSTNNRLIERHPIKTGYFWTSYDFAGNRARQSLFENPLGPGGAKGFEHDGGETIYSLPNGFQAYYLNDAKGKMLAKGPTAIVRDISRKDLTVTNGISCMGCHDQGMRKERDNIRDFTSRDKTFSKAERDQILAMYPVHAEMDKQLEADQARFIDAMDRAGLLVANEKGEKTQPKLNGVEMINALSDRYESDIGLREAAAEFGMEEAAFAQAMQEAGRETFALKRRLEQGIVPRDTFELAYKTLIPQITDNTVFSPGGDAPPAAAEAKKDLALAVTAKKDVVQARDFDLALYSDRDAYKLGEKPVFTVTSQSDCNLTLINVDGSGEGTVIFPNKFQQENRLPARQELQFPGPKAPFQFRLADKGTETVIAVCNASKASVDGIIHNFQKEAFTPAGSAEVRTRKILVEAAGKIEKGAAEVADAKAKGKSAEAVIVNADKKADVLARAAIKFSVE